MTKKYFEAVSSRGKRKAEFIVPLRNSGGLVFVSIKTGKISNQFVSVFTGVDLTPEKVFTKMVDAGMQIEDTEQTITDIGRLLELSSSSKLGNLYEVSNSGIEFEFNNLGKSRSS